jgi:hypothetical protein
LGDKSLTARQLARYLEGLRTVSLATVTARGEPRVATVTAQFVDGCYVVPTVAHAARTRHLRRRPGVSVSEYAGTELAIIVHGTADLIDLDDPRFAALDERYRALSGGAGPSSWGGGGPVYIRIQPAVMFAHAHDPALYPEVEG